MKVLFKKILFFLIILFTHTLYAPDFFSTDDITISNASGVYESNGPLQFAVTIEAPPSSFWGSATLTVHYQTIISSTATEGEDYRAIEGNLIFTETGPTTQIISVPIINNEEHEETEYVYVKISESDSSYSISDNLGYGTIYDDDLATLTVSTFYDKGVVESDSDQTLSMVAYFNRNTTSDITLTYHTEQGTAIEGSDFIGVSSKTIPISSNSDRAILDVIIKGDTTPEESKDFKVIIDSISEGTITDNQATATITDDDTIKVDISSNDVFEGNVGDSNQMQFKIFLAKPLPEGSTPITIHYKTEEGSSPSAQLTNLDYSSVEGDVTFNVGDQEFTINVPITADTEIESDENLRMVITGSSYIINSGVSESEIINDDGDYPGINFSAEVTPMDHAVVEGNDSTRVLQFHFELDNDAVAGTSFDYYTEDFEANASTNDYVPINLTTYNVPIGTRNIDINVTVNGDKDIENDEIFYLKITNEKNLHVYGHTSLGHILNDDGSFPELSFDMSSYAIEEGNNGERELNFTLSLNKPALANSSFTYYTWDSTAKSDETNHDYMAITSTKHTFNGGETNITIPVTIYSDTVEEADELFSFYISNENNLTISGTQNVLGKIIDDDTPEPVQNVGEFRFDDCGADEWKIDSSPIANHATGTTTVIENDDKSYMCTSLNGYGESLTIPHNSAYEIDEGTISIMLYDHHNTWNSAWLVHKGDFGMEIRRTNRLDPYKGTVAVHIGGNEIATNEVYFTSTRAEDGDFDTQWIAVTFTFGAEGMKLYINGELKGSNSYTGGISNILDDIQLTNISGFFDEFYIFKGQMDSVQVNQLYNNITNNKNIDGTVRDCGCYAPNDPNQPFTCDNSMYISSSTNRETGSTGKMWLHRIDTTQNPFDFYVVDDIGATELYNATAYAWSSNSTETSNNYIYGLYKKALIRVSKTGDIVNLGTVDGLPDICADHQLFAGAIYDGYYYVSGFGIDHDKIYKIKLSDKSVTEITMNTAISINDFSFSPDGKFLYGIIDGGQFVKINLSTPIATVTKIGPIHTGHFDSTFSDKNGRFFANDSNENGNSGFYEFNTNTGEKSFLSYSQPATYNDGANCLNGELIFNDYGDAPISYGPSWHNIANGIYLGEEVDHDIGPYNTINADGDDISGVDDDDGITHVDGSDINGSYFELETVHTLKVKLSKEAYLNIWIDKGIDGHFDATDLIYNSLSKLSAGEHSITFTLPAGLTENKTTYLRARVSSLPSMNPTGLITDGEVEDYAIKFGTEFRPLRGVFNIERTDSANFTIMSDERNAWYTQFSGRDFNYSLVFYEEDFSSEKSVNNVTVKIDLVDMDTNLSLYQNTIHIPETNTNSRIDLLNSNDLKNLSATKNAQFKVTYGVDASGNIIQADCLSNPSQCLNHRSNDALDNFSIRPKYFYVSIADKDTLRIENNNSTLDVLRVAAEYDYNLTVIASIFDDDAIGAYGYNVDRTEQLKFISSGTCADERNGTLPVYFRNGKFNSLNFTHNNVGKYILSLKDTTWTKVDADKNQCTIDKSNISLTPNEPSGCNIETISDINLSFYPYQFAINFSINNLPNSGHDDFIYMSSLNLGNHDVAIQFLGEITAQGKNSTTTTNFTEGCVAEDIVLIPNTSILTDNGILVMPNRIQTATHPTRAKEDINISRMIQFNNSPLLSSNFDTISNIDIPVNITRNNFINEQNGTVLLDLRYNIEKHLSLPINPIQVSIQSLSANSIAAYSTAEDMVSPNPYVPIGHQDFNETKNFYFTRVSPDKTNYPKVIFEDNPIIRTPLNIDIFCNADIVYCNQIGVRDHSDLTGVSNIQRGWYISTDHNSNLDGNVTNLTPNRTIISIMPNNTISFTDGRNGMIIDQFNSCNGTNDTVRVDINPSHALLYAPNPLDLGHPFYTVSCTDQNSSELSGVGKTGNIIQNKANEKKSSKIDW